MNTRTLLTGGVIAAPLFAVATIVQALTRQGFDLTRHPASMLENGGPGWIQRAVFLICGALTIGAALATKRALRVLFLLVGLGWWWPGSSRWIRATAFPSAPLWERPQR